jgi:ubiquinone/menaquinone biosynthesis C-methylase UbiE
MPMKVRAVPEGLFERLVTLAGLAPVPIVDTFHAVIAARAIMVATKLCVFDALAPQPLSAHEAAGQLGVDAGALGKLLNVLTATGYLRVRGGRYAPTRLARTWLLRDSPRSLHDNMLLRFLEWQAIEATEDFVRTGNALDVHDRIGGEEWGVYQRGMRSLARLSAGEVARRVRLPVGATAMLDIGGGHGTYSAAFCRRNPSLHATVIDLSPAVESAEPILAEEGMGGRVVLRSGNAFTEDLGENAWDLIFMSHFVHHFHEAANAQMLRRAGRALRADGVVAILDMLRPSSSDMGQTGALLDLYFAITSNAGTWSRAEITHWFEEAELRPGKVIRLRSAPDIVVLTATKPGR